MKRDARPTLASAIAELQRVLGPAKVMTDPDQLICYSYDASFESMMTPRLPDVVVLPADTTDVARTVACAARHRVPVTARGASTGQAGGALAAQGGIVLDMSRMNRILELDTENLQVIVEPGVVHADLNAFLAKPSAGWSPITRGACGRSSTARQAITSWGWRSCWRMGR